MFEMSILMLNAITALTGSVKYNLLHNELSSAINYKTRRNYFISIRQLKIFIEILSITWISNANKILLSYRKFQTHVIFDIFVLSIIISKKIFHLLMEK